MKQFTERQGQIIYASIDLIDNRSIHGLTIKNIANEIKLTEGAIYRHFSSKNDILLGIVQMFQERIEKAINESYDSDVTAFGQIEIIFTRHIEFYVEQPAVTAVVFSESLFQSDTNLSKEWLNLVTMHEKELNCVVERGQINKEISCDIDDKEIIRIIIGSIRYIVTKWRLSSYSFDLKTECSLVIDGLKKMLAT